MRATKFVPPRDEPHKPAKERIARAADLLFQRYGMNVGLRPIAHLAGTQEGVVIKYYRSLQRLQFDYLKSLFKQMDDDWREAEQSYPDDPEAQLRCWIYYTQIQSDDYLSPQWQLSRMAAQLASPMNEGLEVDVDRYRQAERRKLADRCSKAKLRDPAELADKLMLLIEGARNERGSYGFRGPLDKLGLAADDLMVSHGAVRKPPYDGPPD
jgi:AcrR family transcriptional regulator